MEDEISVKGMCNITLLKKECFTGSLGPVRYRLWKQDDELMTGLYPKPFCWNKTPEEQKKIASFPFSAQGLDEAVAWLNQNRLEFGTEK